MAMEALTVTHVLLQSGSSQIVPVSFPSDRCKHSASRLLSLRSTSSTGFRSFNCSALYTPLIDHSTKFVEASKNRNLIPLYRFITSDHLTPVLAYRCLVKEDDRDSPSFLSESVKTGFKTSSVGRYSVVGAQPTMEIIAKENMVTVIDHHEGRRTEEFAEDPLVVPRRIMEKWKPQLIDELPQVFCGGWFGYFSYDTVRYVEKKKLPFSSAPVDDRSLSDVHLGLYDDVVVLDNVEKMTSLWRTKSSRVFWLCWLEQIFGVLFSSFDKIVILIPLLMNVRMFSWHFWDL